jgi:hypothetical protein
MLLPIEFHCVVATAATHNCGSGNGSLSREAAVIQGRMRSAPKADTFSIGTSVATTEMRHDSAASHLGRLLIGNLAGAPGIPNGTRCSGSHSTPKPGPCARLINHETEKHGNHNNPFHRKSLPENTVGQTPDRAKLAVPVELPPLQTTCHLAGDCLLTNRGSCLRRAEIARTTGEPLEPSVCSFTGDVRTRSGRTTRGIPDRR